MAIRYHFDLYPRSNPKNGARLVRFTKLQSAEYRGEANGTGAGRFSLRGDTIDAGFIDPAGLQYVRVVREDTVAVTETVVGGFFLDNGDFVALDEKGTRLLTFGGAGTLSYLQRAVMWSHTYISALAIGQDPYDDTWRLYTQGPIAGGDQLGAVLWRVIYEAKNITPGTHKHGDGLTYTDTHADDRIESALPDLTMGFTALVDSASTTWTAGSGEFKAQVGESVLQVVRRLMEAGLYVSMNPDTFVLNAWPATTHRRSRTGIAWGTNVVRFQSPTDGTLATGNIKSDAKRGIAAAIKRKQMLVGGQDTYGDAVGTATIPWEGFYPSDAGDVAVLAAIASVQLGARNDAGDVARLRMSLGTTPTTGKYLPFEHVLPDDLVTVHTGTSQWDYNEGTYPVAALTIVLRTGGDWDAFVDLGSTYTSMAERAFQATPVGTHSHPPNPWLCEATVGSTLADEFANWTWSDSNGAGGYQQAVVAYPTISQLAFTMNSGLNNTQPNYRSQAAGNNLPGNGGQKYLPCTVGTPIAFAADVGARVDSGHTVTVTVKWRTAAVGSDIQTDTLYTGFLSGGGTSQHITATLTPPATATVFTIGIFGRIDNVVMSTGGGSTGSNPLAGTEPRAARCDHKHHVHTDRAPNVTDDAAAGYPVGTFWIDDITTTLYVSQNSTTGAAVWIEIGSQHAADPDAHLQANFAATAAPTVTDDSDSGYKVGSSWVDTTNDLVYVATDVTVGAAVWKETSSNSGGFTNPMTTEGDLIRGGTAGAATRMAIGTAGYGLIARTDPAWEAQYAGLQAVIGTGLAVITTGVKGDIGPFPFACYIEDVSLLADVSGRIVLDLWVDTYANYPPSVADTITASAKPTLSSVTKSQDSTLTGWSRTLAAGSIMRVNVDSATTVQRVTLMVKVRHT